MPTTEELLQKADLALSDLTTGGLLAPEQQDHFFQKIIDAPTMLNEVRFIRMGRPKMEINKLGLANRILRAADQGTISTPQQAESGTRALTRANRILPTTSKITLSTQELIAEIDLPYEVLEDNIEGGDIDQNTFQQTLLGMIAQATARDLEEKLILGDKSNGGDAFLALQDGCVVGATSNIVNHGGAGVNVNLFTNMINALPVRYHRLLNTMKFYTSKTKEVSYRSTVAQRQTSLGDSVLTGAAPVTVLGSPLVGVSQMPNANSLFLNPKNVIVGMQRDIRMEFDRDIRERAFIIVLTLRLDHLYEEEDMVVKAINIG